MILPCISIRQPWAWVILHGGKNIENRSWSTKVRGPILLHAAKSCSEGYYADALELVEGHGRYLRASVPSRSDIELGGIVGAAGLVDVIGPREHGGRWYQPDFFGFRLERQIVLPFRPCKGALQFVQVELTAKEERVLKKAGLV